MYSLVDAFTETYNHIFDNNICWSVLLNIETKLSDYIDTNKDREEENLADLTKSIFELSKKTPTSNSNVNLTLLDENIINVLKDNVTEAGRVEEIDVTDTNEDEHDIMIGCGKNTKSKVKKVNINISSVIIVMEEGRIKVEKIHLPDMRYIKSKRVAGEKRVVRDNIYDDLINADRMSDISQIIEQLGQVEDGALFSEWDLVII